MVDVHLASLRLQISMNCLISETSEGIVTADRLKLNCRNGDREVRASLSASQIVVEWKTRLGARAAKGLSYALLPWYGTGDVACGAWIPMEDEDALQI